MSKPITLRLRGQLSRRGRAKEWRAAKKKRKQQKLVLEAINN